MNILEEVITVEEAVELTGDTAKTIQRRCKSGIYEARIGKKNTWLIVKASVLKQ
jgi:hypothetical protein